MVNGVAATGGTAATTATANWSRALTLTAGANTITVVASDNSPAHNTMTQNLRINYDGGTTPPPPSAGDLPTFSKPTEVRNPYLPLAALRRQVLEGTVGGQDIRVERTLLDRTERFQVGDQEVAALIVQNRSFVDGALGEIALDYIAQADDGAVYYFGEDVSIYRNGKVVSHEGTWRYGVDTQQLGVIMPAHPEIGTKFQSQNVQGVMTVDDEVLSVSETVKLPAGSFRYCLYIKETLSGRTVEYKYYAPNVGVIKEVTQGGSIQLRSGRDRSGRERED
jgi:hypothetical protein